MPWPRPTPAAYLPDLAAASNNLALSLAGVGQREAALAPAQEAADTYRALAQANPAAYLPDLATSLNNLANHLAGVGQREAALAPAQEAVTLRRTMAQANPAAYLPDLAMSLNDLANHLAGVGQREAALAPAQEAADTYRALAQANPAAYLPDLATSLNNLANHLAGVGQREAALAPAQEAVTLRRTMAQANPAAYLPNLASSLNNLANHLADIGQRDTALGAFRSAIDDFQELPDAAAQLSCALAEFLFQHHDAEAGIRALISLVDSENTEISGATVLRARYLLRSLPDTAPTLRSVWLSATGQPLPAWAAISSESIDLVSQWLNTPSWQASFAYLEEHSPELLSPESSIALEELNLHYSGADFHLQLIESVRSTGATATYRPLLLSELLTEWIEKPSWSESQEFLLAHPEILDADSVTILEDLSASENADVSVFLHAALLALALRLGVSPTYNFLTDRHSLHDLVQQALESADPELLARAAEIEGTVFGEEYPATVHFLIAALLADTPTNDPAAVLAEVTAASTADARDRCAAEIAALIGRSPDHARALSTLLQAVLATRP
ncbi:tetratricopeptide repeat protein [Streptacidiphilus sp. PAMC 29251]